MILETSQISELRRLESNLFHLIAVKRNREFLKKLGLMLMLKKGMSAFLVAYEKEKDMVEFFLQIFLDISSFLQQYRNWNDAKPSSW